MTEDLTKKCGFFNSEYFRYEGIERMQIFIIKQVHVKFINMTVKQLTKGIHKIKDINTFLLQLF